MRPFTITSTARLAFGPTVAHRGRVVGCQLGVVTARNAADAVQAARAQWPHVPVATLGAYPQEEIDATE